MSPHIHNFPFVGKRVMNLGLMVAINLGQAVCNLLRQELDLRFIKEIFMIAGNPSHLRSFPA